MRGLFITFEGTEGCGKSSQLDRLSRHLTRRGHPIVKTREPGGTVLGEQIRKVLLNVKNHGLDPRAELFLYLASRAQHLREVICPALKKGRIVLCDRFSDATLAYQGFGRQLDMKAVRIAVDDAAGGLQPDVTLLLDLDVQLGLARVKNRGKSNRLDREHRAFHERVRCGYLWLAKTQGRRIYVVDASRGIDAVAQDIRRVVEPYVIRYEQRL